MERLGERPHRDVGVSFERRVPIIHRNPRPPLGKIQATSASGAENAGEGAGKGAGDCAGKGATGKGRRQRRDKRGGGRRVRRQGREQGRRQRRRQGGRRRRRQGPGEGVRRVRRQGREAGLKQDWPRIRFKSYLNLTTDVRSCLFWKHSKL